MHFNRIDLSGKTFNRLTFIAPTSPNKYGHTRWICKCSCGNERSFLTYLVTSGETKSCGCLRKESCGKQFRTHGKRNSPSYMSWCHIRARCLDKNHPFYNHYGGRGISICDRWNNFENFYKDMGEKPKNKSIDRINNDGNYEPSNCRWATAKEQNNNKSNNVNLTYMGKTMNLTQWAFYLRFKRGTLTSRFARGWSIEDAFLLKPSHTKERYKKLCDQRTAF